MSTRLGMDAKLYRNTGSFTPESVPGPGEHVLIQRNGNTSIDVTPQVHPEVAAQAVLAEVVGAVADWPAVAARQGLSGREIEAMQPAFAALDGTR